jgi:hypothetical protein
MKNNVLLAPASALVISIEFDLDSLARLDDLHPPYIIIVLCTRLALLA